MPFGAGSGGRRAGMRTAVLCGLLCAAAARAEAPPPGDPVFSLTSADFTAAPKRENHSFPLADQKNSAGWTRLDTFWDEFDGDTLDTKKWWPKNPTWEGRPPGRFNETNVSVSGGQLHLAARALPQPEPGPGGKAWTHTTAAVQSRETVLYGHFEVRAKMMPACICNAFWFYHAMPERWTELDVYEIGARAPGKERKVHLTAHVFHTPESRTHRQWSDALEAPFDPAADFHVYALDWTPERLRWYVDGVLVREGTNPLWHQPLTLNLDVEIMEEWFGLPAEGELPAVYDIDYVRAWTRASGPPAEHEEKTP